MSLLQSDLRSGIHIAASAFCSFNPIQSNSRFESSRVSTARGPPPWVGSPAARVVTAFNGAASAAVEKRAEKPSICTADELHYVSASNSDWKLALWRYRPSPQAPQRNHPLLLLSGVATNAIGYDLSPGSSFARYMSSQGFDTWILEVRGAGLTTQGADSREIKQSINAMSEQLDSATRHGTKSVFSTESHSVMNSDAHADSRISSSKGKTTKMVAKSDELQLVTKLTETFMHLSEKLSGFLNEGLWEASENSVFASQIRDLSQRLVNIIGGGQQAVSPQFFDLQERFSTTIEDFQKQLDLIVKYDWDFDHYLEEDVPAAMEYVRTQCKPKDGKLLAIGHSMGGILLYATLSRHGKMLCHTFSQGWNYICLERAMVPLQIVICTWVVSFYMQHFHDMVRCYVILVPRGGTTYAWRGPWRPSKLLFAQKVILFLGSISLAPSRNCLFQTGPSNRMCVYIPMLILSYSLSKFYGEPELEPIGGAGSR